MKKKKARDAIFIIIIKIKIISVIGHNSIVDKCVHVLNFDSFLFINSKSTICGRL